LHPFWYTPLLPFLFFLSAICVGLAMTIFESSMSAQHFGKQLELPLLRGLGRTLLVVLCIYTVVRFEDLIRRGALSLLRNGGSESGLFLLEIFLCSVAPISLLLIPKVRESAAGLYLASVLCLMGFVTNRMNVAITGMESSAGQHYFPKWTEIAVTFAIVGFGFMVFALAVRYLPIFTHVENLEAIPESEVNRTQFPEVSHARS